MDNRGDIVKGGERMTAEYQKELEFAITLLRRMRLSVHLLKRGDKLPQLDGGLRRMVGMEADDRSVFPSQPKWANNRAIYKIMDQFMCHYIFFYLPGGAEPIAVVIGPYLTVDPSREVVMELAEHLELPMQNLSVLQEFYASLPVFYDPTGILAVVTTLGEVLWGSAGTFDLVDVNYEQPSDVAVAPHALPIEQEDILQQMKRMEERYAFENELMEIVEKGLINRAEVMMSGVSRLNYQPRLADPLRNMKNYCIICNTLLRKAAQRGGVHPLHLDRLSGEYARTIENTPDPDSCSRLIGEMIRAYCRLVRTRAGIRYSAVVQKTLTYVEANLSGDLSLTSLARLMKVTPGYLSTIFHRETGRTLAGYITDRRMTAALQQLKTTRLQVQTIAQLCGFSDPNYFGKQFKRYYGVTPLQYRKEGSGRGNPTEG